MRRSRGYAPQTLDLGRNLPEMLACGGELKNVFCLTKGTHAILSQHIGDLENYETLVFFEETLANLKKLFRVAPRAVAYDLHPGYLSTKYALGLEGLEKIGVQHHHAHIASCMAENGLSRRSDRRGDGRNGLRLGRRDLGRRVSVGELRRVYAARPPALRAAGGRGRGGARAVAFRAGLCGRGGAVGGRSRTACARRAPHDRDGDQYGDDVLLRASVRCRCGADRFALRGQFRRPGGDRTGGDCGHPMRGTLRLRDQRRGAGLSPDDGAHREGRGAGPGGGGAFSQYAGRRDPRDVSADAPRERPRSRVPERRNVSKYAPAGSDREGAARVGVRAVSASQRAAQRWRNRAGAGGDRGGTDEARRKRCRYPARICAALATIEECGIWCFWPPCSRLTRRARPSPRSTPKARRRKHPPANILCMQHPAAWRLAPTTWCTALGAASRCIWRRIIWWSRWRYFHRRGKA